jgi:hypothetical protein
MYLGENGVGGGLRAYLSINIIYGFRRISGGKTW